MKAVKTAESDFFPCLKARGFHPTVSVRVKVQLQSQPQNIIKKSQKGDEVVVALDRYKTGYLKQLLNELTFNKDKLQKRLDNKQSTDKKWVNDVHTALGNYKRNITLLEVELKDRESTEITLKSFDRLFLIEAHNSLPSEIFNKLQQQATAIPKLL